MAPRLPKRAQDGSKRAQDGPKRAPDGPTTSVAILAQGPEQSLPLGGGSVRRLSATIAWAQTRAGAGS